MKKYYKVCSLLGSAMGYYISYNGSTHSKNNGTIHYKIGEWTKPIIENSYLWVFETKEAAYTCVKTDTQLFECVIKNPIKAPNRMIIQKSQFDLFWQEVLKIKKKKRSISKEVDKLLANNNIFPDYPSFGGTVWCSELKLTKALEW